MNLLTLIPARGGSKGVPGKNIKPLLGKPLIVYTIEAALGSKYVQADDVICSTDSAEIAEVARAYGAHVPFLRPSEFATDEATSMSVAIHALEWMQQHENKRYDGLLLLQVTSPLRTSQHIDDSIELMLVHQKDSVISVTRPWHMPFHMKTINDSGEMLDFINSKMKYTRRQDMPEVYAVNGALYLTRTSVILNEQSFFGKHSVPYVMDQRSSIDIDEGIDLELAEFFMSKMRE